MKHSVYLSASIESLTKDKIFIGEAATADEMWRIVDKFLKENGFRKEKYCRYIMKEDVTFIDFGSWTRFIVVEPAFTHKELFDD
jgi:hypothetical protein